MAYVIKAVIYDCNAATFDFPAQKTMYGGKAIAVGDIIYLFASETEGGGGLFARGIVTAASASPRQAAAGRQTPRVTIMVELMARAIRPLGRRELRHFRDWGDGQPATELNFKFYRQATNKIGGISDAAAAYLDGFFQPRPAAQLRGIGQ